MGPAGDRGPANPHTEATKGTARPTRNQNKNEASFLKLGHNRRTTLPRLPARGLLAPCVSVREVAAVCAHDDKMLSRENAGDLSSATLDSAIRQGSAEPGRTPVTRAVRMETRVRAVAVSSLERSLKAEVLLGPKAVF